MALPPPPQTPEENEDWLVTYADAITLLMAFFILFVSFSKVDLDMYDKVRSGLEGQFASEERQNIVEELQEAIEDIVREQDVPDVVSVSTDSKGITIELDANAFFKPGSADLADGAVPILQNTFAEVASPIYARFNIEVEGHTDDDPISTPQFPSNWELSTARASTVVRFFLGMADPDGNKIEPNRLKASGFAETQPKVPNRDESGAAIPENQRLNRRVIIRINRDQIYVPIKIPEFRREIEDQRSVPLN